MKVGKKKIKFPSQGATKSVVTLTAAGKRRTTEGATNIKTCRIPTAPRIIPARKHFRFGTIPHARHASRKQGFQK